MTHLSFIIIFSSLFAYPSICLCLLCSCISLFLIILLTFLLPFFLSLSLCIDVLTIDSFMGLSSLITSHFLFYFGEWQEHTYGHAHTMKCNTCSTAVCVCVCVESLSTLLKVEDKNQRKDCAIYCQNDESNLNENKCNYSYMWLAIYHKYYTKAPFLGVLKTGQEMLEITTLLASFSSHFYLH